MFHRLHWSLGQCAAKRVCEAGLFGLFRMIRSSRRDKGRLLEAKWRRRQICLSICFRSPSWRQKPRSGKEEKARCRGPKTIVASWHCHPESFCASGKFLRITLGIAVGSFRMVWKVSGWSESFRRVWKVSGESGKFPNNQQSFRIVLKVSGRSGKSLDNLEDFGITWTVFG